MSESLSERDRGDSPSIRLDVCVCAVHAGVLIADRTAPIRALQGVVPALFATAFRYHRSREPVAV